MSNSTTEFYKTIYTAFMLETELQFRFLENNGYRRIAGISSRKNDVELIKPCSIKTLPRDYVVKAIYERQGIGFEISYSTNSFTLSDIYRFDGKAFPLRWIGYFFRTAHDRPDNEPDKEPQECTSIEAFKSQITEIAYYITPNMYHSTPWVIEARNKRMEVLNKIWEKVNRYAAEDIFREKLKMASKIASDAFLERDYKRVIECLLPLEKYLSPPDKKKLELAKRKMLQ